MALLAIKVEDSATLPLNEFYDYQGTCYALTRTRDSVSDICIELEDFYDGTVTDETLEHVDIVFVDYLGLVRSSKDDRTPQYLKIEDIVIQMKRFAQELSIPVVLLCQLNREAEKESREPRLSDLRDSGAIEQAADLVVLLHCADEASRRIVARVEKNRHGPKNFDIELERNESYTHFVEISNK